MAADIEWYEAQGMPCGGVYNGPDAAVENVLGPLSEDIPDFPATPPPRSRSRPGHGGGGRPLHGRREGHPGGAARSRGDPGPPRRRARERLEHRVERVVSSGAGLAYSLLCTYPDALRAATS
jgi:hypothetical protein